VSLPTRHKHHAALGLDSILFRNTKLRFIHNQIFCLMLSWRRRGSESGSWYPAHLGIPKPLPRRSRVSGGLRAQRRSEREKESERRARSKGVIHSYGFAINKDALALLYQGFGGKARQAGGLAAGPTATGVAPAVRVRA